MSRTKRGSKPPGFEYWTARPGNEHGNQGYGKQAKRNTHRKERREGRVSASALAEVIA